MAADASRAEAAMKQRLRVLQNMPESARQSAAERSEFYAGDELGGSVDVEGFESFACGWGAGVEEVTGRL